MTIITRDNFRLGLLCHRHANGTPAYRSHTGTLTWDTEARTLDLVFPDGSKTIRLTRDFAELISNEVLLKDTLYPDRIDGIDPDVAGALNGLRVLGAVARGGAGRTTNGRDCIVELSDDLGAAAQGNFDRTATVTLFKDSGKYAFGEAWRVPVCAVSPADMSLSPDFRRTGGGAVLVDADASDEYPAAENWGFPHLLDREPSANDCGPSCRKPRSTP